MDAAARRRELRRKKILQNAEDRIKKLFDADFKHEALFVGDDTLKISAQKSVNNCSKTVDQNCDTTAPREKVLEGNFSSGLNKPTAKQDGHVRKERVANETNEQQSDGKFDLQTRQNNENLHIKENVLDENVLNHEDEPAKLRDKIDGYARKQRHKISQDQNNENATEFINTEPEAVDNKISNVRPVLVMILAFLCFSKSLYLPALSSLLGSSWFLEICNEEKYSFVIPFCFLEIVLLFMPSMRKVKPGKQVNTWLLVLKLCGVSPAIVDAAKIVILEILEFLTDLAMFIFVLVILQNVKEVYAQNIFVIK